MLASLPRARLLALLGGAFALVVAGSAWGMHYPQDWLLENVFVGATLIYLAATYRPAPLTNTGYVVLFVYLGLHELGAHTTYSEVPYDSWFRSLFGVTLNGLMGWQRNHYDRFLHLIYGLMVTPNVRVQILQVTPLRGFWSYAVPVTIVTFASVFYELAEWAAAVVFGGDLGVAYVGTQGDVWDAQRDMALATAGAIAVMWVSAWWHHRRGRDTAAEFAEAQSRTGNTRRLRT